RLTVTPSVSHRPRRTCCTCGHGAAVSAASSGKRRSLEVQARQLGYPLASAGRGFAPAVAVELARRLDARPRRPCRADVVLVLPDPDGETREERRTQRRRFEHG